LPKLYFIFSKGLIRYNTQLQNKPSQDVINAVMLPLVAVYCNDYQKN